MLPDDSCLPDLVQTNVNRLPFPQAEQNRVYRASKIWEPSRTYLKIGTLSPTAGEGFPPPTSTGLRTEASRSRSSSGYSRVVKSHLRNTRTSHEKPAGREPEPCRHRAYGVSSPTGIITRRVSGVCTGWMCVYIYLLEPRRRLLLSRRSTCPATK